MTSDALCNSATMMDSIWHDTPMKHMTDTGIRWHSNVYKVVQYMLSSHVWAHDSYCVSDSRVLVKLVLGHGLYMVQEIYRNTSDAI